MRSYLTIVTILLLFYTKNYSQTCPDSQVRWLSGNGLFIMDWTANSGASTMLSALSSIDVDGCAFANNGNFPCSVPTNLTANGLANLFQVNNAGTGTGNRIRPISNATWSNGNTFASGFSGTLTFNLTAGGSITCTYSNAVLLPIEMALFEIRKADNSVNLIWTTASETNNDYFTIERSADGRNFAAIGMVDGAGNSTSSLDYSYTDDEPLAGTSYYRIKQTDYDGQFSYSDVRAVKFSKDKLIRFSYRPSSGDVNIQSDEGAFEVIIVDMTGREVKSLTKGFNDFTISVDDLMPGTYAAKINLEGHTETFKFVKF
jgi:hypothetical protein